MDSVSFFILHTKLLHTVYQSLVTTAPRMDPGYQWVKNGQTSTGHMGNLHKNVKVSLYIKQLHAHLF